MSIITIEDYKQWLRLPITQDYFRSLLDERTELMEAILTLKGDDREQVIGKIKAIDSIINKMKEIQTEEAANV